MKCLVKNCPNTSLDGEFWGNLCMPCARVLQGRGLYDEPAAKRIIAAVQAPFPQENYLFIRHYDARDLVAVRGVINERKAQDLKWGTNRDKSLIEWHAILEEEAGEVAHDVVDSHWSKGADRRTWHEHLKEELTQVAACAVVMIGQIDKNLARGFETFSDSVPDSYKEWTDEFTIAHRSAE